MLFSLVLFMLLLLMLMLIQDVEGPLTRKKEATQQFLHSISWRRSDGQPTAYSTGSNPEVG